MTGKSQGHSVSQPLMVFITYPARVKPQLSKLHTPYSNPSKSGMFQRIKSVNSPHVLLVTADLQRAIRAAILRCRSSGCSFTTLLMSVLPAAYEPMQSNQSLSILRFPDYVQNRTLFRVMNQDTSVECHGSAVRVFCLTD
jgi:hypothetical protein